ncbi:aminotransferase class V-fold PLP-dependent enzyme [Tenacibaculum ovolyticum]|uniref:pyridoxal phosphate-dependent decarboxylase family protein n=1 Tax=Tenacibaculum ovolyticum TaxID=104270 RepID=UPI0022F3CD7B|nr:aminotransferase class V-fold PLP-dependent enzyme [Tenacibaculum ovolyticum]WBX77983.1 aminotransferase class V-fold PLP-dependent enzyme [Tenacibaculum ovolyticum]
MSEIQNKMFLEIRDKEIFNQAQQYSFEYLESVFDRNVYPTEEALENLSIFNEELPANSTNAKNVIEQLNKYGSPATTATLGGRYFGFVCGSAVPVGLAAKNLGTYWDQAPAMNVLSPIGSKLESVVEKWLVDLFNLPKNTSAGFVSGTSTANLCGLAAARYRILQRNNWDINKRGLNGSPKIRIVTGKQAHSTVLKAIGILGLGTENIEWVDVDNQGRIIAEAIPELDENTILILQAGNVNSGAFDDFETICEKAKKANSWMHIDGAFGLWAEAVDELKYLTKGIGNASSWAVDGHKTLNTPYDCGIILCSDQEAMTSALHMSGSYIIESTERDGMFYTPEMSRRARIIELWSIMKYLGKNGIDEMILTMHKRAKQFTEEIVKIEGFYVENDVVFNQVIVRCNSDEITEQVLSNVQMLRECWLGGSVWFGKKVMRVSICSWATTEKDILKSVKSFAKALALTKTNKELG